MDHSSNLIEQACSKFYQLQENINLHILKLHSLEVSSATLELQLQQAKQQLATLDHHSFKHSQGLKEYLNRLRDQVSGNSRKIRQLERKLQGDQTYFKLEKMIKKNQEFRHILMGDFQRQAKNQAEHFKTKIEEYNERIRDVKAEISLLGDKEVEQLDFITTALRYSKQLDNQCAQLQHQITTLNQQKNM